MLQNMMSDQNNQRCSVVTTPSWNYVKPRNTQKQNTTLKEKVVCREITVEIVLVG